MDLTVGNPARQDLMVDIDREDESDSATAISEQQNVLHSDYGHDLLSELFGTKEARAAIPSHHHGNNYEEGTLLIDLMYEESQHQVLLTNTSGTDMVVATTHDALLAEFAGKQEASDKPEELPTISSINQELNLDADDNYDDNSTLRFILGDDNGSRSDILSDDDDDVSQPSSGSREYSPLGFGKLCIES
jgi:hypothetical protein